MVPDSQGSLGLLTVPIGVLREEEAERVSIQAAVVGYYLPSSLHLTQCLYSLVMCAEGFISIPKHLIMISQIQRLVQQDLRISNAKKKANCLI